MGKEFTTAVLSGLILATLLSFNLFPGDCGCSNLRPASRDDAATIPIEPDENRPVIHTFYARIPGIKRTGMSDDADDKLVKAWTSAWTEAGWQPKVITLADAEKHPDFLALNASLDGMPFGYYDRLCFLRWLAMAQMGGGWMTDYDTFPLHNFVEEGFHLPNNGRLSVFDGIVPSLVSGSADEWHRMAELLVQSAQEHKHEKFWSDMLGLKSFYQQSRDTEFFSVRQVLPGEKALTGTGWGKEKCHELSDGKRAVHFSHHSIRDGVTKEGQKAEDRPEIATEWLAMWKSSCDRKKVAVSL